MTNCGDLANSDSTLEALPHHLYTVYLCPTDEGGFTEQVRGRLGKGFLAGRSRFSESLQ